MCKIKYYGHACVSVTSNAHTLLFDPFITNNPLCNTKVDDIKCDYILISHAHFDHLGDAVAIAKNNDATIISTAEVAKLCFDQGCKAHGMHLGGKHTFDFGIVRVTIAFHGAGVAGGHACGFIITLENNSIYFAGDTALFSDMELLGRLQPIDYALLPIGDNYTMGPDDALEAVRMLKPTTVIPIHYNTWSSIQQDPSKFKEAVEKELPANVLILTPGNELKI